MTKKQTFEVGGMHCASCASIIEKTLVKEKGVHAVEVNYGTEKAKIDFDDQTIDAHRLSAALKPLGYSLKEEDSHHDHAGVTQSKNEKLREIALMRAKIISVIPLVLMSVIIMGWDFLSKFGLATEPSNAVKNVFYYLLPIMATYTLFYIGKPYLLGFIRFLRYGKANMDTLIGIGTSAAYFYSMAVFLFHNKLNTYIDVNNSYFDATIIVIAFISLGKYLEARSKIKTGDAIEKLIGLQAKKALVMRDGKEIDIPINAVVHDDLIVIKPGGKIPVDGMLIEGSSYVDESMISGEPIPVEKNIGDMIVAGTLNTEGSFIFRATKVGKETMLAHIIAMVEEAQGSKAPIQALADKISSIFVPAVLVIAAITLVLWLSVGTHYLSWTQALSYGLVAFVSILVIACPCALGLATPTAIIVGVGKGAKEGILIKDAATLEKLCSVDTVVIDKTGTITKGRPEVESMKNISSMSDKEILGILAALENKSEHPVAHAIVTYASEKKISIPLISSFKAVKGRGVTGVIDGKDYFAGNISYINEQGIDFETQEIEEGAAQGKTPILLSSEKEILAIVFVSDAIKPDAKKAIAHLRALGITVQMLTGDHEKTARYIADQVGINAVVAKVLPEDKMRKIKELQSQGKVVAMAGDGVNDAPALAQADVGIAMATGTDVAIESAGITLLHGDITKLAKAVSLSKITMRGIKQNLFWAFIYNIIGIPLASGLFYPLFGWMLNPIFAGFAMALSSLSVVGNSLRLKTKKL